MVIEVTWKELSLLTQPESKNVSSLRFERYPDRVRSILGSPRAARLLAQCATGHNPELVPIAGSDYY